MARDGPKVVSAFSRPALLKALKSKDKTLLTELLDPARLSAEVRENELRIALQTAAGQGEAELVTALLQRGAKTDLPTDKGVPPLLRAVEKGHTEVVRLLLRHKPKVDPNVRDKHERTPLMLAAFNGYNKIIELLLQYGADVDAVDSNKRTTLLILAADSSKGKWNKETIDIVLATKINVEHVDKIGRTALHWAAATAKEDLANVLLLLHNLGRKSANIQAGTDRGKTALHLAAENNHSGMVSLLLANGAKTEVTSDGHWTPLLNAAQSGHQEVVDLLLKANANVNARTSSGMTALHWAAENNHVRVLRRLLEVPGSLKNTKCAFESTPLSRAGAHGHQDIIKELKPHIFGGSLSSDAQEACHRFSAAVCDFYHEDKAAIRNVVRRQSVFEILYGKDSKDPSGNTFAVTTNLKDIKPRAPDFRWIHLPSNNIAWAEALITKYCLEKNFSDPNMFKSLLRLFGQRQHRGRKVHSRFMRPLCQRIGTAHQEENPASRRRQRSKDGRGSPAKSPVPRPLSMVPEFKQLQQDSALALFMPYLGWETDFNRREMSRTIKQIEALRGAFKLDTGHDKDVALIAAYLNDGSLHVRRTLDQSMHFSVDTEKRDQDQVVYRYCRDYPFPHQHPQNRLKVYMVDQLWLWILGNDLVLTCFPERWNQPKRDVLNLFDGVIENVNSKTRPPVKSAHELAALITDHCSGIFDRHEWSRDEFRFLEMFELSIGTMTRRETALFRRFEADSALAAQWLRTTGKARSLLRLSADEADAEDLENEEDSWLELDEESTDVSGENRFVDRLLNIAKEARLLVECKDIQDELGILRMVLRQQKTVLSETERTFGEALASDSEARLDLARKFQGQRALIDLHLLDIERMDKQSKAVNISLTQVLDLKQKHANALEARFTRDQAQDTARQGKTIMVFTIVTVIFLPMSFIAAFFAINIIEFPHDPAAGGNGLPLSYVSRYVFGIGLGISIPLIAIAFALSNSDALKWNAKSRLNRKRETQAPTIAATDPAGEKSDVLVDKPRTSFDSFHYRNLHRVETGATDRSRRSNLLPV